MIVWPIQKKWLPLQRNSAIRHNELGSVAQLNRASDYGSEGYGFESLRSHKKEKHNASLVCYVVVCFTDLKLLLSPNLGQRTGAVGKYEKL